MSSRDKRNGKNNAGSEEHALNPNSDTILVNRARRAVIKPDRLGACIITGTDKIRSGFGNGDCLMLDFRNLVFAVSDATERFPYASRLLLERFADSLADTAPPRTKEEWLAHVNAVYAGQSYHQKATLSCVAINKTRKTVSTYVIHGGDSVVLLLNLKTRQVEYRTSADMCFAGRAKELLCVDEVPIMGGDYGFVIASDGIADPARFTGRPLERISGSVLSRLPLHEIPDGLANYLKELSRPEEYDDIGVIALSPTRLEPEDYPTILIGGTSAVEESAFQKKLAERAMDDSWIRINTMQSESGEKTIRI